MLVFLAGLLVGAGTGTAAAVSIASTGAACGLQALREDRPVAAAGAVAAAAVAATAAYKIFSKD